MKQIHLIFPHQLFKASPLLDIDAPIYIVEEYLFFKQYPFHKQKIAFHRATMKRYADFLTHQKNRKVTYVEAIQKISDIRELLPVLKKQGVDHINYIDPTDNWLHKRIKEGCNTLGITLKAMENPLFLNTKEELLPFFGKDKKKYHQTTFYKDQRKKRNILMDQEGKPTGGKWTFDTENRKKYPAKKVPPTISFPDIDTYISK